MSKESSARKLYLSFWDICLENLPEGTFTRTRVASADARERIEQARRNQAFHCLSDDDLLAPYHEHSLNQHKALCDVLLEHCGIALSIDDFLKRRRQDGTESYSILPLNCVQLRHPNEFMVVTCHYELPEMFSGERPEFEIALDSVTFHVFAEVPGSHARHANTQ
jgi:hypothetical protein